MPKRKVERNTPKYKVVCYEYDENGKDAVLVDGNAVSHFKRVVIEER